MPDVGDGTVPRLVVAPYDGTTSAVLTVYDGDDGTSTPAVSTTDGGQTWVSTNAVTFTVPGLWTFRWAVTGTGYGREDTTVNVSPDALTTRRAWATTADLAAWINDTVPVDARRMLSHATREIEDLIKYARYDVDETTGEPTDVDVLAALRDAVCEQVSWWVKSGDEHGARSLYTSVSIGSVSLSRASGQGGNSQWTIPPIGRSVYPILRRAGLLSGQPMLW